MTATEITTDIGIREQAAMILDGDERALVELRAVHLRLGQVRQDWFRLEQLDDLAKRASILASSYDVWIGAAARARRGGAARDVAWSAMVWGDCDTAPAVAALATFEPAPTLTVRSSVLEGDRRQAWWRLDRRLGPEELEPVLRRIAAALGSDASVTDRARVLRALGTTNRKRARPEPIEVVSCTGEVHDAAALLRALPPDQGVARARDPAGAGVAAQRRGWVPHGERHAHLVSLAISLARSGITDYERMLAHLLCEFEGFCEPLPPRAPGGIEQLARWAVGTRIAGRERELAEVPADAWWAGCVRRGGSR